MKQYNKPVMKFIVIGALFIVAIELILLALLASQNARYSAYWHARAAEPSRSGELLYVALGDSTGLGIGATSPSKGYVGLIEKGLKEKTGQPVKVVNLSVSGSRVKKCLEQQIPKLKKLKPDVVTIEIGANDVANWDATSFRHDMTTLINDLPDDTVISDIPYFGGGIKRSLEPNVLAANKIILELAKKRGLTVAPLHKLTKSRDSLLTYSADFFHPNNRGYRNWFDAFWGSIKSQKGL